MVTRSRHEDELLKEVHDLPEEMIHKIIKMVRFLKAEILSGERESEDKVEGLITQRKLPDSILRMVKRGEIRFCNSGLISDSYKEPSMSLEEFQERMRGRNIPIEEMLREERGKR